MVFLTNNIGQSISSPYVLVFEIWGLVYGHQNNLNRQRLHGVDGMRYRNWTVKEIHWLVMQGI